MSYDYSVFSFRKRPGLLDFGIGAAVWPHPVDWEAVERALTQALDAVGQCAGLLWWDGSAIGLRLNGLAGLFELDASDPVRGEDRS